MKAELKTAGEDEEKEQKKKEKLERIEAAAAERKKKSAKRVLVTNDRLFDDKVHYKKIAIHLELSIY